MERNTIFFIVVKALHISGGFPAHHQELKNCTCIIWCMLSLVAAIAAAEQHTETSSISTTLAAAQIPDAAFTVSELLMMGGETA
jgi:hypothetical protein